MKFKEGDLGAAPEAKGRRDEADAMGPASNSYYLAAKDATGSLQWQISLDADVRLSVVVRG